MKDDRTMIIEFTIKHFYGANKIVPQWEETEISHYPKGDPSKRKVTFRSKDQNLPSQFSMRKE